MSNIISELHIAARGFVASKGDIRHYYIYTCFMEQLLSDVLILQRLNNLSEAARVTQYTLDEVRNKCIDLSEKLISTENQASYVELDQDYERWYSYISDQFCMLLKLHTLQPLSDSILNKLQDWSIPECSGYDLCDIEVCYSDAETWIERYGNKENIILIGVRTGGAYYAPLWGSCFKSKGRSTSYITVRPYHVKNQDPDIVFPREELSGLPDYMEKFTNIIIVDDQPDSGRTVRELCNILTEKYADYIDKIKLWVAAPGRIYELRSSKLHQIRDTLPLDKCKEPRLWQLLGREWESTLIQKLESLGLIDAGVAQIEGFARPFSEIYFDTKKWMWWNEVDASNKPYRINPRKTSIMIVNKENGKRLLHGKFIGKDLHGEFQFEQLLKFCDLMPSKVFYYDGYLFTEFEEGLGDFRDIYAMSEYNIQIELCEQASKYWNLMYQTMNIGVIDNYAYSFRNQFVSAVQELEELLGYEGLIGDEWISRYVPIELYKYGTTNTQIRSSLGYSHFYWHWKVKLEDSHPVVRRFHIDSNWGGNTCLDLELASFMLENRISKAHGLYVCDLLNKITRPDIIMEGIRERLSEALFLDISSWLRRCKGVTPAGAEKIRQDIKNMTSYIENFID